MRLFYSILLVMLYTPAVVSQDTCESGYYRPQGSVVCVACPESNQYTDASGACVACPTTTFTCPEGRYMGNCVCAPGFYIFHLPIVTCSDFSSSSVEFTMCVPCRQASDCAVGNPYMNFIQKKTKRCRLSSHVLSRHISQRSMHWMGEQQQ